MRADRLISLMLLLQNRGQMTSARLARELEVSRRTVLRDIDALSYAGIPLVTEGGPGGGVRLRDDYRTSLTGLKDDEVRSLFFSMDGALFGDLGWGNAYRMSQLKLGASLPSAARAAAEAAQRRILIDSRWWWHQERPEEALGSLQEAVFADRIVQFGYEHYDGSTTRVRAEAYALVAKSGFWYLVGRRAGEMRTYRVSRILGAVRRQGAFRRDPAFDVRAWWPEHSEGFREEFSSYKCTLRISRSGLKLVQRMAAGRARVVRDAGRAARKDGWVTVELGVESEWYAQLVVFGLGKGFRIIAPRELAASISARMRETGQALRAVRAAKPAGGSRRARRTSE